MWKLSSLVRGIRISRRGMEHEGVRRARGADHVRTKSLHSVDLAHWSERSEATTGLNSTTPAIDTRGIPTHKCLNCGSGVFRVAVMFEDYDIAMWGLDAECFECGAPVTVPCPVDDPAFEDHT